MTFSNASLSRRKALGVFTALGASLVTGNFSASAVFFRRPSSQTVHIDDLPATWVEMQGRNLNDYIDFVANLHLEQISVHQIVSAHAKQRGAVWNSLPPSSLWKNIGTTFKVVDRIAREMNKPVKEIISAYRSPAYNARCPGAKSNSWHQMNYAMDVTFPVAAPVIARTIRAYRNRGLFRGGVGAYHAFTHIDTRGVNIDW
jgi:hypothetical protein